MNTKKRVALIFALVLLGGVALVAAAGPLRLAQGGAMSGSANAPLAPDASLRIAQGGAPAVVAYQGELRESGAPYTGDGHFKFAVVNAAGDAIYWSNDGTSTGGAVPTAGVHLAVSDGLFSVLLGDTALGGMTQALTADVFSQPDCYLRVWFSASGAEPFDLLAPDTRIAAVPYALQAEEAVDADTVDGLHANQLRTRYQNVVVVAKSGGDYTSVQDAIDSIADAAADNAYLVWVAPGVYSETVTMKPYVHLQGAGQDATVITSTASTGVWPPAQATLILASDASLRDLTVGNSGAGEANPALVAATGMTRTLAADVTALALGGGLNNYAIVLSGSGTGVTLQGVTALGENGSGLNVGLFNYDGAAATLRGGDYTGRGGENGWGIFNSGSGATLEAESVTALGENGSVLNVGLYNYNGAAAVLRGGVFTGRGGNQTGGVGNQEGSTLTAEGVTALAENGTENYGLGSFDGATMTVRGATATARGGLNNYALTNEKNVTMEAENVTALAENGSGNNYGLWNVDGAAVTLRGGSFTGRAGEQAWGMYSHGITTTLEAESVTVLGEDGSNNNFGLGNYSGAEATLRGGSFTGREGEQAWGMYSDGITTTLEAESVTALGEDGSDNNYGLGNDDGAAATLRGGSFTGRGGASPCGICNFDSDTTLDAESVTALGEDGATNNFGLNNTNGAAATLRGGSFTARGGGVDVCGICNTAAGTKVEAESVTALAEDGDSSFGLVNYGGAEATLRGGSFIAHGVTTAHGIMSAGITTTLEAESITALGEDGSSSNYGLLNQASAKATLRGGSFTARGGETYACGILNDGTLDAESVTALGEDGPSDNYGLYNLTGAAVADSSQFTGSSNGLLLDSGTVHLGVSQLHGGATNSSGTLTCFQVYDETYTAYSCP